MGGTSNLGLKLADEGIMGILEGLGSIFPQIKEAPRPYIEDRSLVRDPFPRPVLILRSVNSSIFKFRYSGRDSFL